MDKNNTTVVVVVLFLVVALGALVPKIVQSWQEHQQLQREIASTKQMLAMAAEDPDQFVGVIDAWGTPINFTSTQGAVESHKATSAGPDRQFETGDDLWVINHDLNIANVGKNVGHGGSEFTIGAVEGISDSLKEHNVKSENVGETVGTEGGKFFKGAWDGIKKSWGDKE